MGESTHGRKYSWEEGPQRVPDAWCSEFAKLVQVPLQVIFLYLFTKTEHGTSISRSTYILIWEGGGSSKGARGLVPSIC